MQKINQERLYEVIRNPLITEKTTLLSANNQVVFEVATSATKKEIKDSVQALFKVEVEKVATISNKGKKKIFRGKPGQRKNTKKAVVTLKSGQNIDLSTGV